MDMLKIIQSQYLAALAMLGQAIDKCPESSWNSSDDKDRVWNVCYHALFYTHLYLQDEEKDFTPWERQHRDDDPTPYTRADVLDYLAFVRRHVAERVPALDLQAPSGFHWLPFGKLELQFYSIRHIQQHAGELYARLGTRHAIEFDWVSMGPD